MVAACLAVGLAVAGCSPAKQPESIKTVAAFEVPLESAQDRNVFLSVMRDVAGAHGMHLDAATAEELQIFADDPLTKMTVHAAVWLGSEDKDPEAVIMDQGHLGQAWVSFSKGVNPENSRRFREHAMREIRKRWPETLSLPVFADGGLPLHGDIQRTPGGYILAPSAAAKYQSEIQKNSK